MFLDLVRAEGRTAEMVRRLHANAGVRHRHLSLPLDRYAQLRDFGEANDEFVRVGVELGAKAVSKALDQAGLSPHDVDLIVSATVTGLAVPPLDARVVNRVGLRTDVKRLPLHGLGCVAGAAGIARIHDHLLGHPRDVAVLMAVELCTLTVQRDDVSMPNLVASGLFGDGAAAVVLTGADRPPPQDLGGPVGGPGIEVLATRSRFYLDTERAMGWDVGASGLRIVLGVEVPALVERHVRDDVDGFLGAQGLARTDIAWWVAHPGGPKVLMAMEAALGVPREALGLTWASLAAIGNLSSASVLHVLADTLRERPPVAGTLGILLAMGPGFCLEMVLLRATESPRD